MSERTVSVAEAKTHLSELIAAVEAGEDIVITKRGKAVVRLVREGKSLGTGKIDLSWLRTALEGVPYQQEDAGTFMRRVRDTDRY
ncbi:MAG: type II toxin-antitoxin system Phd/YefM family antitoxin [Mycobacteriales bacterium]